MSEKARRAWAAGAVCIAVVAAGAASVAIWQVGLVPAGAQAAAPPGIAGERSPMDLADYARLAELRQRLRLTDDALAGVGCDPSAASTGSGQAGSGEAESALSRLRAWYEADRVAWDRRWAVPGKTVAVRSA